jgi:hypothetical protein
MVNRRLAAVFLVGFCIQWVAPSPAWAQCGDGFLGLDIVKPLEMESIAVIFSGTLRGSYRLTAGQVATFDVERAWKGRVPKQVIIYRSSRPPDPGPGREITGSSKARPWVRGVSYFVMAAWLTAEERAEFGVTSGSGLGTSLCSRREMSSVSEPDLRYLGPGYAPQ